MGERIITFAAIMPANVINSVYRGAIMRYMLTWSIPTNSYNDALDAFLAGGAPMPEGLTALGRWHAPGSYRGWLLCDTDDLVLLSQHIGEWASLLKVEVTPVIGDEQAGAAAAKIRNP